MKRRNIIYVLLASAAMLFAACNKQVAPGGSLQIYQVGDYELGIDKPLADGEKLYAGTAMMFVVKNGDGDVYTLWKGDKSSDYANRIVSTTKEGDENFVGENLIGLIMSKTEGGQFVVKSNYEEPGEYTATLVGRNIYEKGAKYKEMIYTKNVVVVDTACFLFHPDPKNSAYRFVFTTPSNTKATYEELPGNKIQPKFKPDVMASAKSVSMNVAAGDASIWWNGAMLPYNQDRGYYQWQGVDFTVEQQLTVKARSAGYERTYTMLPVKEW